MSLKQILHLEYANTTFFHLKPPRLRPSYLLDAPLNVEIVRREVLYRDNTLSPNTAKV